MLEIAGRQVGGQARCYIVAELSANHVQDLQLALDTVKAASASGADAIKLQTVDPGKITIDCDNHYFQVPTDTLWGGKTLYQLECETYLPREMHKPIIEYALSLGLDWFSSPFDCDAVDFLESLDCPAYKIASFEMTDPELIAKAAGTGKPIILSTGIASVTEIQEALDLIEPLDRAILLKCTSAYPTPLSAVNLRAMLSLQKQFAVEVGVSDHTLGSSVPVAAVAMGAKFIEKHFVLNRTVESADKDFSMIPEEFSAMVNAVRETEELLGTSSLEETQKPNKSRIFSRSLFFVRDINAGDVISREDVRSIRPGHGLAPKYLSELIGARVKGDLKRGTPVQWEHIVR